MNYSRKYRRCQSRLSKLAALAFVAILPFLVECFGGESRYFYDAVGRLSRAQETDGSTVEFVYDNVGNRLIYSLSLQGNATNLAPLGVSNPNPVNGFTNGSTKSQGLSWAPAVDPNPSDKLAYYVYFGTTTNPPLVYSSLQTNWTVGPLHGLTTYYWRVIARDNHNAQTAGPLWSFTTSNEPPVVNFTSDRTNGWAPLTVSFRDRSTSSDDALIGWQWDFDNNGVMDSTNQNPVYTFNSAGDYTVKLMVTDEHGASTILRRTNYISIIGNNVVDLAAQGLDVDAAGSYRHLTVRYAVTNRGTVSLLGKWPWADGFFVSGNSALDAGDAYAGIFYELQALPAGANYARTNEALIPQGVTNGYYLLFKADANNEIGETNEANNVLALLLTGRLPDLTVGHVIAPSVGVAGQSVQVAYDATNVGPLSVKGQWNDGFYMSTDSTWDPQDPRIGNAFVDQTLVAGARYSNTNIATLPRWPPGNYYLAGC